MSKKEIIVGITGNQDGNNQEANWWEHVPDTMVVDGYTIKFFYGAHATVQPFMASGYSMPYDFIVTTDYRTIFDALGELIGDRLVKCQRPYKTEMLFNHFKAGLDHDIEVLLPIGWSRSDDAVQDNRVALPSWVKRIIAKSIGGARGEDQAIIPLDHYLTWKGSESNIPVDKLEREFPEVKYYYSSDHKNADGTFKQDVKGFSHSSMMFLPYIEEVVLEFRVLRGGDTLIAYIRDLEDVDGKGIQRVKTSDTCGVSSEHYPDYHADMKILEDKYGVSFDNIRSFLDQSEFYYGSVDFYIYLPSSRMENPTDDDRDNDTYELGIFESCVQHGTRYMSRKTYLSLAMGYLEYLAKEVFIPRIQ